VSHETINSAAQLADLCQRLARADRIGIDTEFVSEDTFRPELCLVQVVTQEDLAVIDPYRAGKDITPAEWDAIWTDLVDLMREGVRNNRIDTVRPEHTPEAMARPPRVDDHGGEVYVYRRAHLPCHICGGEIRTADLAARNLFWCPRCQQP